MSKLETNTIDTVSGTSTLQVGSTNTSTITLGVSGDTINVPSGVTINNNGTQTGFGGANTPAFFATADGQNVTDNTYTKVNLTEVFDTDSAFASSKFTVPSGKAGKYFFYASLQNLVDTNSHLINSYCNIYKNGSVYKENRTNFASNNIRMHSIDNSVVMDLAVGDYVELYTAIDTSSSQPSVNTSDRGSSFGGYKIIE